MRRVRIHAARGLLLVAIAVALASCARQRTLQTITGLAQGTTYTLQWWSEDRVDAGALTAAVTAELERLDALLSNYRADSVLERFNATRSVEAQALPSELIKLFDLAADMHRRSEGCFDPSVRPLVRLWGFDGDEPHVPADDDIAATLARRGVRRSSSSSTSEHVQQGPGPDLEIDMASIGQGYTVAPHQRRGRRARATTTICSRSAASSPDAEHGRTARAGASASRTQTKWTPR